MSKDTQHTPGPWKQHKNDPRAIVGQHGEKIAQTLTIGITSIDADELANARLIAAAPELLYALKLASATFTTLEASGKFSHLATHGQCIRAAIAKANIQREI